uniref:F5/8 type C domain-containing protein n=1 Tax=Bicosoecida sp. CB-2014 TaxID=1486930 RepID=A0A7S1GDI9_9STRA
MASSASAALAVVLATTALLGCIEVAAATSCVSNSDCGANPSDLCGAGECYTNVAFGASAGTSSRNAAGTPSAVTDGARQTGGAWFVDTDASNYNAQVNTREWLELELGTERVVSYVAMWNRPDCCAWRLRDMTIELYDAARNLVHTSPLLNAENIDNGPDHIAHVVEPSVAAKFVRMLRTPDWDHSGNPSATQGDYSDAGHIWIQEVEVGEVPPVPGCTDEDACNFDAEADVDDGSCTFPASQFVDCAGACLADTDGDTFCDGEDTCDDVHDALQLDGDGDGVGDACETCVAGTGPAATSFKYDPVAGFALSPVCIQGGGFSCPRAADHRFGGVEYWRFDQTGHGALVPKCDEAP